MKFRNNSRKFNKREINIARQNSYWHIQIPSCLRIATALLKINQLIKIYLIIVNKLLSKNLLILHKIGLIMFQILVLKMLVKIYTKILTVKNEKILITFLINLVNFI